MGQEDKPIDYRARTILWGAFSQREWQDYCNSLIVPALKELSDGGPYVFYVPEQPELAMELPEHYLTPSRIQNLLSRETNISGWKCSFDMDKHSMIIDSPPKPGF